MADITYCINAKCPFKDCERHLRRAKSRIVSVANFDGVCRRYIDHLMDELRKDERGGVSEGQ